MRKLLYAVLGLAVFFVAIALIVPWIVDIDQYRPRLVEQVNNRINGKMELGRLKLSLWGRVRVETGGLEIADSKGAKVLAIHDAWVDVPLLSLLRGAPEMTLRSMQPEISVAKSKAGTLNVISLFREPAATSAGADAQPAPRASEAPASPQTPAEPVVLPGLLVNARLSLAFMDSALQYRDEATGLVSRMEHLDFKVRDLSLSRPMDLELRAQINSTQKDALSVAGQFRMEGKAEPKVSGGTLDEVALTLKADLGALEIRAGELFHKPEGIDARLEFSGVFSPREFRVKSLIARFLNAELKASGALSNLDAAPSLQLQLSSNDIELQPWGPLIPLLRENQLGGIVKVDAQAQGPAAKLGYRAKLGLTAVTAKSPRLKAQPVLNGVIDISTDQIENLVLSLKAPGNDLRVKGSLVSFASPRLDLTVTSSGLNLDALINWPPKPASAAPAASAGPAPVTMASGTAPVPTQDLDLLLDPLRETPVARNATGKIQVDIKSFQARDVQGADLVALLNLKDLTVTLSRFETKVWSGSAKANAVIQLAPKVPAYRFSSQVNAVNLGEAVASQFAAFKDTLTGAASFDIAGEGSSFNPEPATLNLKAKGSMKVTNATFRTVDVAKMAGEGLNQALAKVAEKIPALKGRRIGGNVDRQFQYESVSSDFSMAGGKFSAPNFFAKAAANQGIDLKGSTVVGLKDLSLDARWEVIDTWNLLKAREVALERGGVRVENVLAEGGTVRFPVRAGCTLLVPCYSYADAPEYLAKVALANLSKGMTGQAKTELKKKAEELIQQAPPSVQKKLEDLGKKIKLFN